MPKYLFHGSYTAEGMQGLQKDTASARRDAIAQLVKSAGGSVECIYYAFGEQDVYCVIDLPDNTAASASAPTAIAPAPDSSRSFSARHLPLRQSRAA
jgi:uncharacterized protein with GYD domain